MVWVYEGEAEEEVGGGQGKTRYMRMQRGERRQLYGRQWKTAGRQQEDSRKTGQGSRGRRTRRSSSTSPMSYSDINVRVCAWSEGRGCAAYRRRAGGRGESAEVKCEQRMSTRWCPAPTSSSSNRRRNLDESTAMEVHGRFDAPVSYGNSDCEPMSFG